MFPNHLFFSGGYVKLLWCNPCPLQIPSPILFERLDLSQVLVKHFTNPQKTETNVTWRHCWWKKSGNQKNLGCKKHAVFYQDKLPTFDAGFLPSPVWMIFFSSEMSSLLTPRIVKTRQMPSTTCAKMAMHRALCDYFGIAFAAVEGRMQNIQMLWIWQSLFYFLRDIQFRWYCCGETENLQNECCDQCCTLCDVFSKLHLSLKDGPYGHKSEVIFWLAGEEIWFWARYLYEVRWRMIEAHPTTREPGKVSWNCVRTVDFSTTE